MAKMICKSRLLHNGVRYEVNEPVDTVKAKMDADLVKNLAAQGVLAEVPAPAKEKETGGGK